MRNIYTLESIKSSAERTLNIISDISRTPYNKLKQNMELRKDLGLNDLEITDLIMTLEDEFSPLDIPNEHGDKWKTVGDVLFYIARRLSGHKSWGS